MKFGDLFAGRLGKQKPRAGVVLLAGHRSARRVEFLSDAFKMRVGQRLAYALNGY